MRTLALATIAIAVLALNMPANAHMRCGAQWPNDDVNANSVYPTFSSSDCMARQLNQEQLDTNTQILVPAPR
jgi:hypothetical protein